jgi:protocatechuate 3,4-dioxygenase beta subunit
MGVAAPVGADMAAMLAACSTCRPWAEQDQGPYHRDAQPERREITEDRDGLPLQLGIRFTDSDGHPTREAMVEIWHCDALGRYSGFPPPEDSTAVTPASAPRAAYVRDQTFLRGRQPSDAAGMVEFRTIYPGWYPGRTVHIHLMVHAGPRTFTTQLYFPEESNDEVLAQPPYAARPGRDTTNASDGIFSTGGEAAVLDIRQVRGGRRAGICLALPRRDAAR